MNYYDHFLAPTELPEEMPFVTLSPSFHIFPYLLPVHGAPPHPPLVHHEEVPLRVHHPVLHHVLPAQPVLGGGPGHVDPVAQQVPAHPHVGALPVDDGVARGGDEGEDAAPLGAGAQPGEARRGLSKKIELECYLASILSPSASFFFSLFSRRQIFSDRRQSDKPRSGGGGSEKVEGRGVGTFFFASCQLYMFSFSTILSSRSWFFCEGSRTFYRQGDKKQNCTTIALAHGHRKPTDVW